jgi:hypothetical protein
MKTYENNKRLLIKEQTELRSQIQKSESQKTVLLDKVNSLQKEVTSKHSLAAK